MTRTLTGKRRFRTHSNIFGKTWLVLQVEVQIEEKEHHTDYSGLVPEPAAPYAYTEWRDARLTDLTEHEDRQHIAKRKNMQETRLLYHTIGVSFTGLCMERALVLQVRTRHYENTAGPSRVIEETWKNAGVDDLGFELEFTG